MEEEELAVTNKTMAMLKRARVTYKRELDKMYANQR
jgi:hypothetical protein